MPTSKQIVRPANPSPTPSPDDLATELTQEWERITLAAGALAEAIRAVASDAPDLAAARTHVTAAITEISRSPQTLSLLYPKLKR